MHHAKQADLERNISIFKKLQVIVEPLFWGPIIVVYILLVGQMTLQQFYFMEAVMMLMASAAQVLTGTLADIIGRKKTILIGTAGMILGTAVLGLSSGLVWMWVADALITLGFAFYSGSEQGILRSSISAIGAKNNLRGEVLETNGKATSRRFIVLAFCSLAAGHLFEIHPRLPVLLSLPGMIVAWFLARGLVEPPMGSNGQLKFANFSRVMREGFKTIWRSRMLLWLLALAVLLEVASKVWFFTYNPYFKSVGIPVAWYGYIFFGLNLVAWFVSRRAHQIENWLGEEKSVWLLVGAIGIPIVLMGLFVCPWASLLVLSQNVYRGLARPLYAAVQSHHAPENLIATIDSVRSGSVGLGAFLGHLLFRALLERHSLPESLTLIGLGVLMVGGGLLFWYRGINQKEGGSGM